MKSGATAISASGPQELLASESGGQGSGFSFFQRERDSKVGVETGCPN